MGDTNGSFMFLKFAFRLQIENATLCATSFSMKHVCFAKGWPMDNQENQTPLQLSLKRGPATRVATFQRPFEHGCDSSVRLHKFQVTHFYSPQTDTAETYFSSFIRTDSEFRRSLGKLLLTLPGAPRTTSALRAFGGFQTVLFLEETARGIVKAVKESLPQRRRRQALRVSSWMNSPTVAAAAKVAVTDLPPNEIVNES